MHIQAAYYYAHINNRSLHFLRQRLRKRREMKLSKWSEDIKVYLHYVAYYNV